MHRIFVLAGLAGVALLLGACVQPQAGAESAPPAAEEGAVRGKVTDLARFERFIATRPTPAEFSAHYPDVLLVLPGMIVTKELRSDHSRYFPQLDADGRIGGGRFM
jgi:PBP1b-binding outer membrane lipoprotein LpoB